jgi:hypothetical protein
MLGHNHKGEYILPLKRNSTLIIGGLPVRQFHRTTILLSDIRKTNRKKKLLNYYSVSDIEPIVKDVNNRTCDLINPHINVDIGK